MKPSALNPAIHPEFNEIDACPNLKCVPLPHGRHPVLQHLIMQVGAVPIPVFRKIPEKPAAGLPGLRLIELLTVGRGPEINTSVVTGSAFEFPKAPLNSIRPAKPSLDERAQLRLCFQQAGVRLATSLCFRSAMPGSTASR